MNIFYNNTSDESNELLFTDNQSEVSFKEEEEEEEEILDDVSETLELVGGEVEVEILGGKSPKKESVNETLASVNMDITSCIIKGDNCMCSNKPTQEIIKKVAESKNIEPKKNPSCDKYLNILLEVYNCDSERCVLERLKHEENLDNVYSNTDNLIDSDNHTYITKSLENIKPVGPSHSTQWLSNDNLDQVLSTYQKEFDKFKYYPTCLMNLSEGSLSEINLLNDYNNRENYIACVVNTTQVCRSDRSCGDHWTCIYIDMSNKENISLEFFNSAGSPPTTEILTLFKNQIQNIKSEHPNIKFTEGYNTIQHQEGQSECGVYCLYFIRSRLENIDLERFKNSRVSDEAMIMFRRYIFDVKNSF